MQIVIHRIALFFCLMCLGTVAFAKGWQTLPFTSNSEPSKVDSTRSTPATILLLEQTRSTESNNAPSAPVRLAPGENGLLDRNDPVVFQWNHSKDADGDQVSYELQITRDFDGFTITEEVADTLFVAELSDDGLPDSAVYYTWTLQASDNIQKTSARNGSGHFSFLPTNAVPNAGTAQPEGFDLSAAYPNPFNSMTIIRYHVDETTDIRLAVYNLLGEEVIVLKQGKVTPGAHLAAWRGIDTDNNKVSSGTYIVRMEANNQNTSLRVTFVK